MSTPNGQQPTPAAWYPDPDPRNPGGQRWWDGTRWTEHSRPAVQAPGQQVPGQVVGQQVPGQQVAGQPVPYPPQAPHAQPVQYTQQQVQPGYQAPAPVIYPPVAPGTSSLTTHIWLVVGLPLLSTIAFLFVDFSGYFRAVFEISLSGGATTPGELSRLTSSLGTFTGTILLVDALNLVIYGLTVMFAYFDYRELSRRGVVRPFHWAWQFLPPVYVIGRTVVAHRRKARDSLWPIWATIAVFVIGIVLVTVKIVIAVNSVAGIITPYMSGTTS
ncbi:hypothetical protein GCM10027568_16300 [Humibacter soli]